MINEKLKGRRRRLEDSNRGEVICILQVIENLRIRFQVLIYYFIKIIIIFIIICYCYILLL